jgi:hypothetical protein
MMNEMFNHYGLGIQSPRSSSRTSSPPRASQDAFEDVNKPFRT